MEGAGGICDEATDGVGDRLGISEGIGDVGVSIPFEGARESVDA